MLTPTIRAPTRAQARAVPAPTFPKPSIATAAPSRLRPRWLSVASAAALTPAPRGEVVHCEPFVALRPQRNGVLLGVEEISGICPHVRAGQEDVAVRLERAFVRGEYRIPIATGEADTGLGAGAG